MHSFCLQCLEEYCSSIGKLPGDEVPCPECRHEFHNPDDGVAGLPAGTHGGVSGRSEQQFAKSIDDEIEQVTEYLAPRYTPVHTDDLLTDDRNFIGDVATDTGMQFSFSPSTSFNRDDLVKFDSNKSK